MAGKKQNLAPVWKKFWTNVWYWDANIISWSRLLGMHSAGMQTKWHSDYRQYCYVENTAHHCRLELFHGSNFAGDLEDSEINISKALCILGCRTFVPISWMCEKQTSVSHSSTESEIMSLDAGLRMDGLPTLELWDLVIEVLKTIHELPKPTICSREATASPKSTPKMTRHFDLSNVDQVSANAHLSEMESQLYIFEDNQALIKMIIKGRSPTMRHVSRTHRVALDWLFDRIILDPKIQIEYVESMNQLADMLAKGSFHTWRMEQPGASA